MKSVITIAFAIFFVLRVALGDDNLSGPKLVCDEPEYFFGERLNTLDVEHEFVLRNEGNEDLIINRVHSGCGCVLARPLDKVIPGGESSGLRARFSLKGREGDQRHRILVESNDPLRPRFDFYITGKALAEITIEPDRIFWGNIMEDESTEKTIQITFHRRTPVALLDISGACEMFKLQKKIISEGEVYQIVLQTVPPLKTGSFDHTINITTDSKVVGTITVPMHGRVVGELFSMPEEIVFDSDTKDVETRFIIVRSSRNKPFRVLEVKTPDPAIIANVRTTGTSRSLIDLKNIKVYPGLDGAEVKVLTDYKEMPELIIPIRINE